MVTFVDATILMLLTKMVVKSHSYLLFDEDIGQDGKKASLLLPASGSQFHDKVSPSPIRA